MPAADIRIGQGFDIHRLQQGGELVVGGVVVAEGVSAVAHSDGDVVLHALVDAILGALGLGDIGEHFPNTDETYRGAPSSLFLDKTLALMRERGYAVGNADVLIQAERPKLKAFKPKMKALIESRLAAPANVKAGTNEGCDAIGRGEAIGCHAVVLLVKSN